MNLDYDVIIVGGGPGGLTAAIYAARANLKTVFIEKGAPGGKMVKTSQIENWSGIKKVTGPDLSLQMFAHAKEYAEYKYGNVKQIISHGEHHKEVILESGDSLTTNSIIIATGTIEKIPETVKNIHKMENRGVSYCAICDGPLFKGEEVSVIGGGNSAAEESIYLSSIATKVHIFVRKDHMRAEKEILKELTKKENIIIHYESTVTEILGDTNVSGIKALVKGKETTFDNVKALFPYIGLGAVTDFVKDLNITDELGYIKTNEDMETSIPGIFAVGDVRVKRIRQIATAVADGAIAGKLVTSR